MGSAVRQSSAGQSNLSIYRRAAYAAAIVFSVMFVGTVGMHYLAGYSYINAFYFMSMLATAEGPAATPPNAASMIFASIMAFVSIGSVIVSVTFLFGPFFGRLFALGDRKLKTEEHKLLNETTRRKGG